MKKRVLLVTSAAVAPLLIAVSALAQTAPAAPAANAPPEDATVEEVVVTGELVFRNRTNDPNPVLSYDLEYFQQFEPVSVGEMLKRVPGVTFTSDVLEYDGVQMRGLSPEFTQVLINGRRPPGGESDRTFFVDRIPAELVERIEIVRAPRADQPSEGVAGTLNVVLKEGAALEGGFVKVGALINDDGEIRPSGSVAYAGRAGETTYWAALNYQGRRNPKKKESLRYADEGGELDNIELQDDTRDGVDVSANGEVTTPLLGGRLRLSGLYVDTDRDEDEVSLTYENDDGALVFDEAEVERERIAQQTYSFAADAEFPFAIGDVGLNLGYAGYREESAAETDEGGEEDLSDAELVERALLEIQDDELSGGAFYRFGSDLLRVKAGVDLLRKTRDGSERTFEIDDGEEEEETPEGAIYTIEESRLDPYVRFTYQPSEAWTVDAGLRYETTSRDVETGGATASYESNELNPSLHVRFSPSREGQFRVSLARTVRRPGYDLLSPYRQEEEPADEDELIGNPALENETAWGLDAGYEHRLGRRGIVGVNVFYRDVQNLIELTATGEEAEEGGSVYTPRNIGDGVTWGVEIDFSAPLGAFGLPETGLFFNYTWLESQTTDSFTDEARPFRNQPSHIYNIGLIQNLPAWGASLGASLSGRDEGFASNFDEEVVTAYDNDLEAFVEKRFAGRYTLRFTASNLLDREKRETFRVYDGDSFEEILENRREGDLDEFEQERERSGPLYQVTLRASF